jgi:hypothetical protein
MKTQIINVSTGKEIIREMTEDELQQLEIDRKGFDNAIAAEKNRIAAKAALLAKLGLTADEAKLLLS